MRTYEITADKKLRITEGDTSIVTTGHILFIKAEGIDYVVASKHIQGHATMIFAELEGPQVKAILTDADGRQCGYHVDEKFNTTLTWDSILINDGSTYHRPGSAAAQQTTV